MAVEIRELVIKAIVTADDNDVEKSDPALVVAASNQQIIQECVSQVLKILKQHQNR